MDLSEEKKIKTLSSKMTTNTIINNYILKIFKDSNAFQEVVGKGRGENGGKGTGNKKHKWYVQNGQGEGKNSIGNGEANELICMTHGHELSGGNADGRRGAGWR